MGDGKKMMKFLNVLLGILAVLGLFLLGVADLGVIDKVLVCVILLVVLIRGILETENWWIKHWAEVLLLASIAGSIYFILKGNGYLI